jgi:hypothetical protein
MTEQKHTPEPWKVSGTGTMRYIDVPVGNGILQEVATCMRVEYGDMEANARRIVACVNACAGISTEVLEYNAMHGGVAGLEQQRDQLRAALQGVVDAHFDGAGEVDLRLSIKDARAALAATEDV